jgi:acetyltransferase-like isoleucine patch superfamily enzyme
MLRHVGEGEYGAISIGDPDVRQRRRGGRRRACAVLLMLDVAAITIGAACQIATRVQLLTATHPIDPEPRRLGWEYGEPITIADNVWLGGGVIVCPA